MILPGSDLNGLHSARIVAGTLTLLAREIREMGHPVDLWNPELSPASIRELAVKVGRGEAQPLWVEARHPARGLLIFRPSPWESEILGVSCARLLGPFMVVEDQSDREARVRKLARLAIAQGEAGNHRAMTIKTFHDPAVVRGFLAEKYILAEIGSSLVGPVPEEPTLMEQPSGLVFIETEDLPMMADEVVAGLGDFFYDGHFRHDPGLGPEKAQRLWSQIALNDLQGQADPAVVLWDRRKDRVVGIATMQVTGQEASLSILAVTPPYQGRGMGRLLLGEALNRLVGRARLLKVETASYNLPALRLYQNLGLVQAPPLVALRYYL